jgi:dimethylhistidine N-methyltransferase
MKQEQERVARIPSDTEPAGATVRLIDTTAPHEDRRAAELAASLAAPQPWIAPKYFYDAIGSALFTAICELPEYYPTRTEASILARHRNEIAQRLGPGSVLIDLGAGDCRKAASLFEALAPSQYVAVDIAVTFIAAALEGLAMRHPSLPMLGVGMDFTASVALPPQVAATRRLFFYPGSSIGNFPPPQAVRLLSQVRAATDAAGGLLIGVDLAKPAAMVEPAYDDALGITAAFNLNVLAVVNRILGANFSIRDWRHVAFLNEAQSRIEMHVEALRAVEVSWTGGRRRFEAGERIHTENSYKYTPQAFSSLLEQAGFRVESSWTDEHEWFALVLARPVQ